MSEKITAELRTEFGKGAARRIRREHKIPAVIYGHGGEATHITLPGHETTLALRHHGTSAVLDLVIDGKDQLALTKQVQVDDIKRLIEHIDFVAVKKGEKVTAEIGVVVVGEAARETVVSVETSGLEVEADPTALPETIEVSVEGVQAGTMITAGQINLPAGVTLVTSPDTQVVHVGAQQSAAQAEAQLEALEAGAGIVHDAPESAEATEGE